MDRKRSRKRVSREKKHLFSGSTNDKHHEQSRRRTVKRYELTLSGFANGHASVSSSFHGKALRIPPVGTVLVHTFTTCADQLETITRVRRKGRLQDRP